MNENLALKQISLMHKAAINSARIKEHCLKRKNAAIPKLISAIERDDIKTTQRLTKELYAIIDGVERPLYQGIVRKNKNYLAFAEYAYASARSTELKATIESLAIFIREENSNFEGLSFGIIAQANILEKENSKDILTKIQDIQQLQEKMNHMQAILTKRVMENLLPLFTRFAKKKTFGGRVKDVLRISAMPSRAQMKEAMESYDEQIKYNVALMISEIASMYGAPVGAFVTDMLTGNKLIGATVGAIIGDFAASYATFLPTWYIFNMKDLFRKDRSAFQAHIQFFIHTAEILVRNLPPVAVCYAVTMPMNIGLSQLMNPGLAVGITGYFGSAIFQSLSTWMNYSVFKKIKADKINIKQEIQEGIDILDDNNLMMKGKWWWFKKRDIRKSYVKAAKGVLLRMSIIETFLTKNEGKAPKGSDAAKRIRLIRDSTKKIISQVKELMATAKKFEEKDYFTMDEQQGLSKEIIAKRDSTKILLKQLLQAI